MGMKDEMMLREKLPLIVKSPRSKTGHKTIPAGKWFIDRNTPVGDDADVYERKPYGGMKYVPWRDIIGNEISENSL